MATRDLIGLRIRRPTSSKGGRMRCLPWSALNEAADACRGDRQHYRAVENGAKADAACRCGLRLATRSDPSPTNDGLYAIDLARIDGRLAG
jgi:hypothetical protein